MLIGRTQGDRCLVLVADAAQPPPLGTSAPPPEAASSTSVSSTWDINGYGLHFCVQSRDDILLATKLHSSLDPKWGGCMDAVAETLRLPVAEQLAGAPPPPTTALSFRLKTTVKTYVALITKKALKPSRQEQSSPIAAPNIQPDGVPGDRHNTLVNLSPDPRTQRPSSVVDQHQAPSSTTADDSLITTRTQTTSRTSIAPSNCSTCIQGYWVSDQMPSRELQLLWAARIQDRLTSDLIAHIRTEGAWLIEFCMLGKTQPELKPYVVVTCVEKQTKRDVEVIFKSLAWLRDLMRKHRFGFITFQETVSLSAKFANPIHSATLILPGKSNTYCGSYMESFKSPTYDCQACTIGGLLHASGKVYALTAGHAFMRGDTKFVALQVSSMNRAQDYISPPAAFGADGDTPDASIQPQEQLQDQRPATIYSLSPSTVPESRLSPVQYSQVVTSPQFQASRDTRRLTKPDNASNQLDWAIIEFEPSQVVLPNVMDNGVFLDETIGLPDGTQEVHVIVTGKSLSGVLNPTPATFSIASSVRRILNPVYRITLSEPLGSGSSGAWVIMNGKVCGQIVASKPGTPWVYMQSIRPILEDIATNLKVADVQLLSHTHPLANRVNPIAPTSTGIDAILSSSAQETVVNTDDRRPSLESVTSIMPAAEISGASASSSRPAVQSNLPSRYPVEDDNPRKKDEAKRKKWAIFSRPREATPSGGRRIWKPRRSRRDDSEAQPAADYDRYVSEREDEAYRQALSMPFLPRRLQEYWRLVAPRVPYAMESFIVRHEFRRKQVFEHWDEPELFTLSSKVYRIYNFSIVGTLNEKLRQTRLGRDRYKPIRINILLYFAIFYYLFCMPVHWWVKNKHRDVLDTERQTIVRRKRVHKMLGPYRSEIKYEYDLRRLGLPGEDLERGSYDHYDGEDDYSNRYKLGPMPRPRLGMGSDELMDYTSVGSLRG